MTELNAIAQLRSELDLTLAQMGERVGLSKSQMHEVERTGQASLPVALEIEKLSGGRIDAASLSEAVRLARAACQGGCNLEGGDGSPFHAVGNSAEGVGAATGQAGEMSGQVAA